jgi:dipeptidyl aminopeptidase/acylaminoacyl peptidase
LYVVRTKDLAVIALPEIPTGVIYQVAFAPDSSRVGFVLNRPTAPADVFSIDFEARKLTRWTQSELGGLVARNIVEPELFRYRSFDGRDIPAFIYRPNARPPYPVLIRIHGGPEGQARPRFSYRNQFYANQLGVALIAPNVRGSTGYGKTYLGLDDGELREDSVADIGALLDWIDNERDLDGSRVAVMGGSYGGYMVLASLVHYGGKLRAGVESVGITNFVTFLQNTQGYRQDLRRIEYGDERDPEVRRFLESISPLNAAEAISDPLLISQGFNDPRVPASESEQLVEALKARGVPVWYVLAMNEGHGFRRKINVDFLAAVTAHFLRTHLVD